MQLKFQTLRIRLIFLPSRPGESFSPSIKQEEKLSPPIDPSKKRSSPLPLLKKKKKMMMMRMTEDEKDWSEEQALPWPLLMKKANNLQTLEFYSIQEGRWYHVLLPADMRGKPFNYSDSSHGWLFVSAARPGEKSNFLLNPIIGKRIPVPALSYRSHRALLWSAPTNPNCVFLYKSDESYCFYCPTSGRLSELRSLAVISNFVSYDGKIYGVDLSLRLVVIDPRERDDDTHVEKKVVELDHSQLQVRDRSVNEFVLVESCGELLLVVMVGQLSFPQVFRADTSSSKMGWVRVDSLGDRILFLVGECSISVSASEVGSGRGNRIYYIPRDIEGLGGFCWVEFDVENGMFTEVCSPWPATCDDGAFERIWMTPNLQC